MPATRVRKTAPSWSRRPRRLTEFAEGPEHPQGPKTFNGKIHQCFGIQNISKVEGGRLKVVHKTKIEDGLYEPEGDYTTQPL